jgi:hypothetical protein
LLLDNLDQTFYLLHSFCKSDRRSAIQVIHNDLNTETLGDRAKNSVVRSTQRDSAYRSRRESILDQLAREQGLSQEVHAKAVCLCLNDDEVLPIETDVRPFGSGCDPMVAAHDDEPIDPPPTDAWARRHDKLLF